MYVTGSIPSAVDEDVEEVVGGRKGSSRCLLPVLAPVANGAEDEETTKASDREGAPANTSSAARAEERSRMFGDNCGRQELGTAL